MNSHILRCLIATAITGITAGSILITDLLCDPIPAQDPAKEAAADDSAAITNEYSPTNSPETVIDTETSAANGYVLRLSGNTLYVFAEGTMEPLESYTLESGWLPDYDRILLEYGMHVPSKADLHALLEDYTS